MLYKYNKYVNIPGARDVNASRAPVAPGIPGPFSCPVTSCTIHVAAAVLVILMEAILYLLVEESKKCWNEELVVRAARSTDHRVLCNMLLR